MGLMDKLKTAAQDVAGEAKKATSQAQSKLEQSQTRKKMDDAAKQLGYEIYRAGTSGTATTETTRLIAEMHRLEDQLGATEQGPPAAPNAETTLPEQPATPSAIADVPPEPPRP